MPEEIAVDPVPPPYESEGSGSLDVGLLLLLVVIVGLVAISNLWLRRRAERGGDQAQQG